MSCKNLSGATPRPSPAPSRRGSDRAREGIAANLGKAPAPPDLSNPSMRSWLAALPAGSGRAAAFETRIKWSPGGATSAIIRGLRRGGYRMIGKGQRFIVKGSYGPLRDGELERARQLGAELAKSEFFTAQG